MILFEHYIAPSKIHGLGVFSAVNIKMNSKVWEFNACIDIVIKKSDLSRLPDHVVRRIETRAEFYEDEQVFVLGADGDSFMNHSDNPNLYHKGRELFASKDIIPGEELTCNYRYAKTIAMLF